VSWPNVPAATPLQVKAKGAAVSSPSLVAPLKNWTFAAVPSESDVIAAMFTVAGAAKLALVSGWASVTVGGWSGEGGGGGGVVLPTYRIFATEGTPAESTMKSM
jgi:hypothetical protein